MFWKIFTDIAKNYQESENKGQKLIDHIYGSNGTRIDFEKAKQLAESGADCRMEASSALRGAALLGQHDLVSVLLQRGADLTANNFEAYQWAYMREVSETQDKKTVKVIRDWAEKKGITLPKYKRDLHPDKYPPRNAKPGL